MSKAAAKAKLKAVPDTMTVLDEVIACIDAGKPVRKDLDGGGRLHIDRPLPFVCLHVFGEKPQLAARDVASANASYLLVPDRESAAPIIAAIGPVLKKRFGGFLVLDIGELDHDELLSEDAPFLPPFEITLSSSSDAAARKAVEAFATCMQGAEVKFRTPRVALHDEQPEPPLPVARSGGFPLVSVRFAPIYRQPGSEDGVYADLREMLVANIFDAGLQAFAAFVQETGNFKLTTHRALGRKAFIDAVERADRSIDDVASTFDFLLAVTPINADAAWEEFKACGFERAPAFLYRPLAVQVETEKRKLFSIAFDSFEDPVLYKLYREKQQELDLQLTMIASREKPHFVSIGRALYGSVEPWLLAVASDILDRSQLEEPGGNPTHEDEGDADCYFVERKARAMINGYEAANPLFEAKIELRDDLPAGLMVSGARLLISRKTEMASSRVDALLCHEIGVHLLTYFNGSAQGLRLFRSGLAGYEGMQEGLAVFAEYLAGGMTRQRLRLIAARVVACHAMLEGAPFRDVFASLVRDHGFREAAAFNLVLRLYRGGGLAKDAIYLRGLMQLLHHIGAGGSLEPFWMGKIAASHFTVMQELSARGLLKMPAIRPDFLDSDGARQRLEKASTGLSPLDMIGT
ncbi:flavohemoglobin expression-modulating QEGLA motif protein [Pararhizobium sp.]|uniref:flavohemoglobin expression-modulating QEGLA motif protein n=1 Tax=Pararhizobium sp. TaxID=1977563 RepID=UPI00271916FE|nr:flavohemoglobin expression-modulating QEGLA motif protein [Pararhizobium sp.]MDO9415938.1 flavohemoglobin expression-modulating QEGLA motif protein [Pararhizobium sp.]